MYAFVEPWLTELFGVQGIEFPMEDGTMASLVDEESYVRMMRALRHIHSSSMGDSWLTPTTIESYMSGIKTTFMRYWVNPNLACTLAGERSRTSEVFQSFMGLENPRFSLDIVKNQLLAADRLGGHAGFSASVLQATSPNDGYTGNVGVAEMSGHSGFSGAIQPHFAEGTEFTGTPAAAVEAFTTPAEPIAIQAVPLLDDFGLGPTAPSEPIKVGPDLSKQVEEAKALLEKQRANDFVRGIADEVGVSISDRKSPGGFTVVIDVGTQTGDVQLLYELADKFKKNIFFTKYESIASKIAKRYEMDQYEVMKHLLVINCNPSRISKFRRIAKTQPSICLGRKMVQPFVLVGESETNEEIIRVQRDSSLTTQERQDKIKEILDQGKNSPYHKYDNVYKDLFTNVVWGVQDKYTIFLLFEKGGESTGLCQAALKEISRRHAKELTYQELFEIDKGYFKASYDSGAEEYVELAESSAKSVHKELVSKLDSCKQKFNEYMDAAMEESKEIYKLEVNLSGFDYAKLESQARKKAQEDYNEVLGIENISCILVENGIVNVYTKNMYVQNPKTNKWHDIGTFHITIGFHGTQYDTSNTVRIYNTKFSGYGMSKDFQAPHIYADGHVCHGNLASGMANAYREKNLYAMVYQLMIFLQSVNTDDAAGKLINTWPEVTENVAKGIPEEVASDDDGFNDAFENCIPVTIN